ncbi:unnamed protein product [Effrenium voratum]|nr:unnamed protein product [Effrenium voratum]
MELVWPPELSPDFTAQVAEEVLEKGFCSISAPLEQPELVLENARGISSFALPHLELEEGLLGRRSRSKCAFLGQAQEPLASCLARMEALGDALGAALGEPLGFRALPGLQQRLLREPLARSERRTLSPGPLTEEEVDRGLVEQYLGFLQSRRLSVLYVLSSSGTLELFPQGSKSATVVPLRKETLVVFRQDLFSYSLVQGANDAALQGWVVALREEVAVQGLEGDFEGMEDVFGRPEVQGLAIPIGDQVNIMTFAPMIPGRVSHIANHWNMHMGNTDCYLEMPILRWDIDIYYTSDPERSLVPKSYTKHAGMFPDDEILGFDNTFFGISDKEAMCWPPCLRLCLEKNYEALQMRGYDRKTLKGKRIGIYNADIGIEFDPWTAFQDDPDLWATARPVNQPSAGTLGYFLGVNGPMLCIDTACSSSLVSSNLLFNTMRKKKDPEMKEAVSSSMINCLSPFSFVGLSAAGMLGRMGRSMSFDNSANGYARGEAVCAAVFKSAEGPADAEDRLASFVTGFVNQDGRSASLTAPNGPSQQLCIRSSHRLGGLLPSEVWCTENHGTGTALGDPIEVGSVRSVFWKNRQVPVVVTTGKSHQGHSEASAGLCGIIKTINTILNSTAPPQCHLKFLNSHIDDVGFPGHFPVEVCPLNVQEKGAIGGLNSFGFGGTNSRGEVWAMSKEVQKGRTKRALERATARQSALSVTVSCSACQRPMCFLCGMAMTSSDVHRCSDIREEVSSYDTCSLCYTGSFHFQGIE